MNHFIQETKERLLRLLTKPPYTYAFDYAFNLINDNPFKKGNTDFKGYSQMEIIELERALGNTLPKAFKLWLQHYGNYPRFFTKYDIWADKEQQILRLGEDGYNSLKIATNEGDNPPVYYNRNQDGKKIVVAPSFTQYMADRITKLEEVLDYRIYLPRRIELLRKEYFKSYPNALKNEPQAYFEGFWVLIFPELGVSVTTISTVEQELGVKFPEIFKFWTIKKRIAVLQE